MHVVMNPGISGHVGMYIRVCVHVHVHVHLRAYVCMYLFALLPYVNH